MQEQQLPLPLSEEPPAVDPAELAKQAMLLGIMQRRMRNATAGVSAAGRGAVGITRKDKDSTKKARKATKASRRKNRR